MRAYDAPSAVVAVFLAMVCIEGVAVMLWRWLEAHDVIPHAPLLEGRERVQTRRSMMFWLTAALLMEGSHDLLRAGYYFWHMTAWPVAASFWLTFGESIAVLGLIRTFTRHACGEWGWTAACVLPLAAALGVLFR